MSARGINSPTAASDALASLLKNPRKSGEMLRKAYSSVTETESITALDRTDISKNKTSGYKAPTVSESETAERLGNSSETVRSASARLMDAGRMTADEMTETVKELAEGYNGILDSLKVSNNYVAVSSGNNMTGIVRSYAAHLSKAGISVNPDNTLSVDTQAVKNSAESIKTLFRDDGYSIGSKLFRKASEMSSLSKLTGNAAAGIYNRSGMF